MSTIGFWTAVSYPEPKTLSHSLLSWADGYFSLGCKRAEVLLGRVKDGREAVTYVAKHSSFLGTVWKILTLATVIFPLIVLFTKMVFRFTHRFYLYRETPEMIVLQKVQAQKPLSLSDLKVLPLSQLSTEQIRMIFNLDVPRSELSELRRKFALISASEAAKSLYTDRLPEECAMLFSEKQYEVLDLLQHPEAVSDVLITSLFLEENFDKDLSLIERVIDYQSDLSLARDETRRRIEQISQADLQVALEHKHPPIEGFYAFLADEQVRGLDFGKLSLQVNAWLFEGLGGLARSRQEQIQTRRKRVALLDFAKIEEAIYSEKISPGTIRNSLSDEQFSRLDLKKMKKGFIADLFTKDDLEESKRLYQLLPHPENAPLSLEMWLYPEQAIQKTYLQLSSLIEEGKGIKKAHQQLERKRSSRNFSFNLVNPSNDVPTEEVLT